MRNIQSGILVIAISLFVSVGVITACSSPTPTPMPTPTATEPSRITPLPPPTATSAAPTADGDTIMRMQCGTCHTLERFLGSKRTRNQWEASINRMVRLSAPDTAVLLDYLAKTFGP